MCFGLEILGGLASVAGTALSVAGSVAAGRQQQAMAEAQAQAIEQQREAEAKASAFEQMQERRRQELAAANARAQVGASGVGFEGSPSAVLAANAAQGQLDIEAIQYGSTLRQNSLTTQAGISRFQGKQAKQAGIINGISAGLTGISNMYDPNKAVKFGGGIFSANWG